jgi:CheY-like chemotaxis protein
MDVQMPGMDGFEACSRIRQSGTNVSTPVVFVTGSKDPKSRARACSSGANDFVEKPFLTSEITLKALSFALRTRLQTADRNSAELAAV